MGKELLGGLLLGAGRGIASFQETKRQQQEQAFNKRLFNLQFKELGLRIEKAEFERDKRVALGTPEEQADAERTFDEEMNRLDIEAKGLENTFTQQKIDTSAAGEAFTNERTRLLGLESLLGGKTENNTKDMLASLKARKKILQEELDGLRDAGLSDEELAPKQAEIDQTNDAIVRIEEAVQQGLVGEGNFPVPVMDVLTDLFNTPSLPPPPSVSPPREAFGTGESEPGPRIPLLKVQSTPEFVKRSAESLGNLFLKAPLRSATKLFTGEDPFAKKFRFTGTDSIIQPGMMTLKQVQRALEMGIIEEAPLKDLPSDPVKFGTSPLSFPFGPTL